MSEREYCHHHGKYDCQTCADEILSLGIQSDKDRIAALEREIDELRKDAGRLASLEHTLRHLGRELAKLDKYRLCMSYNDSYFGEPSGTVKRVVVELRHCIDAAIAQGKGE